LTYQEQDDMTTRCHKDR